MAIKDNNKLVKTKSAGSKKSKKQKPAKGYPKKFLFITLNQKAGLIPLIGIGVCIVLLATGLFTLSGGTYIFSESCHSQATMYETRYEHEDKVKTDESQSTQQVTQNGENGENLIRTHWWNNNSKVTVVKEPVDLVIIQYTLVEPGTKSPSTAKKQTTSDSQTTKTAPNEVSSRGAQDFTCIRGGGATDVDLSISLMMFYCKDKGGLYSTDNYRILTYSDGSAKREDILPPQIFDYATIFYNGQECYQYEDDWTLKCI